MPIFLLVVLTVYGGMHAYVFFKASTGLSLGQTAYTGLAVFMIAMVLAPFAVRLLERSGHELPASVFAYIGFTWMGFVFLFFCSSLLMDAYRLLIWTFRRPLMPSPFAAFVIPLAAAALITAYGFFEALSIRAEHVVLEAPGLGTDRVRIAQVTDIHLGIVVGPQRLEKMLQIVREARPDILVSTGDLLDSTGPEVRASLELFTQIRPPMGKYAVTGNHEYYAGLEEALAATREAGFTVLRQESFTIPGVMRIAGVDDPAGELLPKDNATDAKVLGGASGLFTLFLKHRPLVESSAVGLFGLQLSGHTHRGQIFPFRLVTRLFFPRDSGLYSLGTSYLYASRGTGTWGPPVRFISTPEVTIIDLVKKPPGD